MVLQSFFQTDYLIKRILSTLYKLFVVSSKLLNRTLLKLFPREMESNNTKRLSQYTNMFVVQLGPCLNTIHSYFHCYSLAKRNNGCHCFQLTTTAHPRYLGRTLLTFIVLLLQINVTFCYIKILPLFQT